MSPGAEDRAPSALGSEARAAAGGDGLGLAFGRVGLGGGAGPTAGGKGAAGAPLAIEA